MDLRVELKQATLSLLSISHNVRPIAWPGRVVDLEAIPDIAHLHKHSRYG